MALLSACGTLGSARMLSPGSFGMDEVNAKLYVEPAMGVEQRQDLQRQIGIGRAQVEHFYGDITTAPCFVACVTAECALRFGSHGERAAAFGASAIRLSHNGLAAALVAHEWSHVELYQRVGGWPRVAQIPRWFDEGVAVAVAGEARHSEANWREIQSRGVPAPALTELVSRSDWNAALIKYGETRPEDPGNLRAVYSAAGHEVRHWLACAGPAGTAALLTAVSEGAAFDSAYRRIGGSCVP
ncbi:MAG: hypothetical protein H7306_14390 [Bacteriovorax sp.]|nr:hypothetical protein [Rhizobacter sp.]